jgi:hypothetical protein
MSLCAGIKADGGRCGAQAMRGSEWCVGHDPDKADARRRRASKGGKRGGRGRPVAELAALRNENAEIRRRLLAGGEQGLAPNVAAVAVQSLNTDARLVVAALKAREQEELVERLEELETLIEHQKEEKRRGA